MLTCDESIRYYQQYNQGRPEDHYSLVDKDIHILNGLVIGSKSKTILDYGSGRGLQYTKYGLNKRFSIASENVTCYDIGVPEFSTLPSNKFDGVICTDVLEHIPVEYLDANLETIFSKATKFVFVVVFCGPADYTLPNGENAHCTIEEPEWWHNKIRSFNTNDTPLCINFRLPI